MLCGFIILIINQIAQTSYAYNQLKNWFFIILFVTNHVSSQELIRGLVLFD